VPGIKLVSDQINERELAVIIRELSLVLEARVEGDVVELGCYVGTTSLFLQDVLVKKVAHKQLHVYDSFEGLPSKADQDQSPAGEQFKAGELHASKQELIRHFKHTGLPLPIIHKGWFEQLKDGDMPPKIAFAFLDGDFYTSIMASLKLIWPHLQPGATVLVDDYNTEALPGVRAALDEWSHGRSFSLRSEASLAIIKA
jgi:O-methyltransferase